MEMNQREQPFRNLWRSIARWFDNAAVTDPATALEVAAPHQIDLLRILPFAALHLGCFAVFMVGTSVTAVGIAVGLYVLRMFAVTAFYHRYFSHRAFRTSRAMQFVFALIGASAVQRGPLWWASHHRHHHAYSDTPRDAHSAKQHGFLWSHLGWFLARENFAPRIERVTDLARFPELRFLDRYDSLVPIALGIALYGLGELLRTHYPALATSGPQLLVWGLCISTIALYHATFTVNSLAHRYGSRRYATNDASRNNLWISLLTLGEGWHNNHHHYAGAARQGFYWWELDLTYYALRLMAMLGLIRDLKLVPVKVLGANRIHAGRASSAGARI